MKVVALVVAMSILVCCLSGCSIERLCADEQDQKQYSVTFLTLFDTVTTIVGYAENEEEFACIAQEIHDDLMSYHKLFDIYNNYDGISNLKTINDKAGIEPVKVDPEIINFLLDCKYYYDMTSGIVNVAMGAVLRLWHDVRVEGADHPDLAELPNETKLRDAATHTDIERVVIDKERSTVFLKDAQMRLDVGAVAKGWAVQRVAQNAPEGILISVGGNVCATGAKDGKGTPWVIGIENPNGGAYLHTISLTKGSVVTSGDYQRGVIIDGVYYHHIIDPVTLYPSRLWRSVTIICEDSGLADALSTALFLLPIEAGLSLLQKTGAEAMWVDPAGEKFYSSEFEKSIVQ